MHPLTPAASVGPATHLVQRHGGLIVHQLSLFSPDDLQIQAPVRSRMRVRREPRSTPAASAAVALATCPAQSVGCSVETTSRTRVQETLDALHARTAKGFRAGIDGLLLPEERIPIEAAEAYDLRVQMAHLYDAVVHRLTLELADAIGWPRTSMAELVEPNTEVERGLRCVTLNLNSRGLIGDVCFKVTEISRVLAPIPASVLEAMRQTREYWAYIRYLEPMYARGRLLRSLEEVRQRRARPIDPLVVGFVGAGPLPDYGLDLRYLNLPGQPRSTRRRYRPIQLFILAHYD